MAGPSKSRSRRVRRRWRRSAANGPRTATATRSNRGVSPVVGTLLLLAVTVCLAAVVVAGVATWSVDEPTTAAFELTVDGDADTIVIEHVAGDSIDVRDLSVTIAVDGTALSSQPSVPFVGTSGFYGAPTGPFNGAADPQWRAGERAGLTVASTNTPDLEPGDFVTVRLTVDGQLIAELEADAT